MTYRKLAETVVDDCLLQDLPKSEALSRMVSAGIPHHSALTHYRIIMTRKGLMLTMRERSKRASAVLREGAFNPASWAEVETAISKLGQRLPDTDRAQAIRCIRAYAREAGLTIPRATYRSMKIQVAEYMVAHPTVDYDAFACYIHKTFGKDNKVADKYWFWFQVGKRMARSQ